ncbi:MAG: DUF6252 family protein [Candidatus Eiseniibacteriota bacterium]
MRPRFLGIGAAGAFLFAVAGCGGGGSNPAASGPNQNGGGGPMTATIDGAAWSADETGITAQELPIAGAFLIQGTEVLSTTEFRTVSLSLYNIAGTGTYPLGMNTMMYGGTGLVVDGGDGWGTPLSGAAGTVNLTVLDPARIAGTFSFSADASTGSATGTKTVTNGAFDLLLASGGSLDPVPANMGGRMAATVGGSPWNAATVAASTFGGSFILATSNTAYTISISVPSAAAPGTYVLGGTSSLQVTDAGGSTSWFCCSGGGSGSGSVTIDTLTADRATGSFQATLDPVGSGATLGIVGGTFDVGLP